MKGMLGRGKVAFAAMCFFGAIANATAVNEWQEADIDGLLDAGQVVDADGYVLKDKGGNALVPNCAFGSLPPPLGQPFKFFWQAGDPGNKNLLIFHDGGGACWNRDTCLSPLVPNARAAYDPKISESPEGLALAGGILSEEESQKNPFKGWTKVFIPYCTGDVGWGNNDATYDGVPFPVHHRGYANVRLVVRWLQQQYAHSAAPEKIAVTGVSAGAYAAPGTVFPEVKKIFPRAQTYLLADSGNGVVTNSFLDSAEENWKFKNTLPVYLANVVDGQALGLPVRFYGVLTWLFPKTRFGQFQNAFDSIQTIIYATMKGVDPSALDQQTVLALALEWSAQMRLATNLAAAAPNGNYRFYTAAGSEHGILVNVPDNIGFVADQFYSENSARSQRGKLSFRDWTADMIWKEPKDLRTSSWQNATCFPYCLPTQPGIAFLTAP